MKYFLDKTDLPFYDGIIKNPEYHIRAKGIHHKIVYMTPDQYMKECAKMFKTSVEKQYEMICPELIKEYKAQTLAGSPMPMLSLEPPYNQEGRHRAIVAKELGIKKIPVIKVWKE